MFSALETAPALVKLMENGLGVHPLVNVSKHVIMKTIGYTVVIPTLLASCCLHIYRMYIYIIVAFLSEY